MPREKKETVKENYNMESKENIILKTVENIAKVRTKKVSSKAAFKTINKNSNKISSKNSAKAKSSITKTASPKKKIVSASIAKHAEIPSKSVAPKIIAEHYDLPFRYNETLVKILAQTPNSLFVYWDISDSDRENLLKTYGENFFNDTIPFLRVTNQNVGYSFDVNVDDFANGWYVSIEDAKATYSVSLFRKQRPFRDKIIENEIYVTTSNAIEAPNDHILFEKEAPKVLYKNVKTNAVMQKDIPTSVYNKSRKAIYGLYQYYQEIYQNENIDGVFNLNNPSSGNPTSTFK